MIWGKWWDPRLMRYVNFLVYACSPLITFRRIYYIYADNNLIFWNRSLRQFRTSRERKLASHLQTWNHGMRHTSPVWWSLWLLTSIPGYIKNLFWLLFASLVINLLMDMVKKYNLNTFEWIKLLLLQTVYKYCHKPT